jgi:beta-N-acetylhexosaminidase
VIGGGVLVLGFEGTALTAEERRILARVQPAGITLVPRNVVDGAQLAELVRDLRSLAPRAILAIDGEGGRVDRLRRVVAPAPAAADLARHPPALTRRSGRWIGAALRLFDFDLDLAPVVDLDHGKANNALDRRCFGSTPRSVGTRGKAFIEGLAAAGVGACLKHFPGLGGAGEDTHLAPSRIELSARELELDLAPFRRLAPRTGVVMVGHAIYPALDSRCLPATLSSAIATTLLREGLSFSGALLSDDLEMGALAPFGDLPGRAEAALVAGCDGVLFCRWIGEAPAIAERLARPRLRARLEVATGRLGKLRLRLDRLRRAAGAPASLASVRTRLASLASAVAGA